MKVFSSEFVDFLNKNKSSVVALIFSLIIWILFFLILIFAPIEKKQQYEDIQIILDAPSLSSEEDEEINKNEFVENNSEETTESIKESASSVEQEVVQKSEPLPQNKKVETVETKTESVKAPPAKPAPKVEEKVVEPAPQVSAKKSEQKVPVYEIQKSTEELMNEQMSQKRNSPAVWDDSMFEDSSTVQNNTSSQNSAVVKSESGFSGVAGSVNQREGNGVISSSTGETTQTSTSSSVANALSSIKSTSYSSSSNGIQSNSMMEASKANSGGTNIKMVDGSVRTLISPKEPIITIKAENSNLIDSTVTVTINFTILESGNVPKGEISITPVSLLPLVIRDEVSEQISKWIFEPAKFISNGKFEYTIIKK